jgi:hypothetical protein
MVTYQRLKHIVADKVHGCGRTGPSSACPASLRRVAPGTEDFALVR